MSNDDKLRQANQSENLSAAETSSAASSPPSIVDNAQFDLKQKLKSGEIKVLNTIDASDIVFGGKNSASERLIAAALDREYYYAMLGLVLGLLSIVGGIILFLKGVAGSTSWTANVLGLESKLTDAAPGAMLFVAGLFYVWVTKPNVVMKNFRG